jgi:hypothetical protein
MVFRNYFLVIFQLIMKGCNMKLVVGVPFLFIWVGLKGEDNRIPKSEVVLTGTAYKLGDELIYELENTKNGNKYLKTKPELQEAVTSERIDIEGVELD